jgi:hypothetical protein
VLLAAGETVQLAIVFPPYQDPLTPYMYHCHLMWHEDEGMMAQFTVVEPDQVDTAPRTLEVDHQHIGANHHPQSTERKLICIPSQSNGTIGLAWE